MPLTALSLINIGNSNSNFEPYLGLRRVVGGPAPVLRRVQLLSLLLLPVLALLVVEPGIVKKYLDYNRMPQFRGKKATCSLALLNK